MKAKKKNRVYQITKQQKEAYKADGFDIFDEKGKLIERGNKPTVKRVKELEDENEKLKAEIAKLKKADGAKKKQ